ncbi:MAG: di-heme oxidoredictase family protein [Planctomycetota bacterium]|nr:di-heme oxidoredictase family protein [Planctomycetota bacterium]
MRLFSTSLLLATVAAPLLGQSPQPKMGAPLAGLTTAQLQAFEAGRADFSTPLSPAQGLGPIFNQVSCANCHNNPVGGPGGTTVTRFGYDDGKGGFDPLVGLGGSLLQQGATNPAAVEVIPGAANVTAQRVTPSVLGAGLIEAIPDAAIEANETTPPSTSVSGRVHWVTPLEDPTGPQRVGKMGWKAQLATVLSFSGDAAQNEMGLTNRLLPTENAPNGNLSLLTAFDTVADPEDTPDANGLEFIDRITNFQRYLAAPPQTPRSGMAGEVVFDNVGCADCHVSTWTTSNDPSLEAAIRNKTIHPYSDFLLHDMGVAADFIGDGDAGTQELRTPSLWGVRSRNALWHDGRVVGGTLQTRILGAGGVIDLHAALGSEARTSALAFQAQSAADQLAVVAFLDSLGRAEFDWDGDNDLDEVDLAAFVTAMAGGPYTPDDAEAVFDINQDGVVDLLDRDAFALVYEVDCNGNGVNDLADVVTGGFDDANQNLVPDECEYCQVDLGFAGGGSLRIDVCGDDLTAAGSRASFQLVGGVPNAPAIIVLGVAQSPTPVSGTEFLVPQLPLAAVVELFVTDNSGELHLPMLGGGNSPSWTWVFQAATYDGFGYDLSNGLEVVIGAF